MIETAQGVREVAVNKYVCESHAASFSDEDTAPIGMVNRTAPTQLLVSDVRVQPFFFRNAGEAYLRKACTLDLEVLARQTEVIAYTLQQLKERVLRDIVHSPLLSRPAAASFLELLTKGKPPKTVVIAGPSS